MDAVQRTFMRQFGICEEADHEFILADEEVRLKYRWLRRGDSDARVLLRRFDEARTRAGLLGVAREQVKHEERGEKGGSEHGENLQCGKGSGVAGAAQ